ncbi:carboxypeptidase regulatory-like domain-containing protein [Paenibacillus sp. PR3]|uniref:Carboxypeptidase regulatory-like domain-containing protein n=1 Tax=Paenibacillus terricola TaxID=2763503 RepID=A0ABR8MVL2_9BACL|nr:carboxypeptidase-like regulatory domain-containing protein [Paenibacillus terricola]MBD3919042.1 carboxypeptidase regulatory-like domain-containing protein [Paenibacillus terricola]
MITKARLFVLFAAAAVLWLWTASHPEANAHAEVPRGRIELDQTSFVAKSWQSDGTHLTVIKGKLTYGEQPVANALLQVRPQGRNIVTREDGSFELLVDRSLIAYKPVSVVSVQDAMIAGKPIESEMADSILSASSMISVYHPIEVTKVATSETDASRVKVYARFIIEKNDKISFFQVDKYRISGKVEDANGSPVKDAIVWIDREIGEGFAKSTPTDRNGRYEMYYWPEEEETNLTVIVGTHRYTLPDGKVFILPRDTSVDIQIRLPKEGLIIDDKSPNLVCTTSAGAKYNGLLAGLDVPPGTPYSVTIPDRQGRFVLTVPKATWEKHPLFFETILTKFIAQDKVLRAGDELPIGLVKPGDQDPRLGHLPR